MPYIKSQRRAELDDGDVPLTAGELAYRLTGECLAYIFDEPPSYAAYAEVVGILETVKLEFYRRAVAPYEQGKIEENGDVF